MPYERPATTVRIFCFQESAEIVYHLNESDSDTLLVLGTGSESPPVDPKDDSIGNEGNLERTGKDAMLIEISPLRLRRRTRRKWSPSPCQCHVCDQGGECNKRVKMAYLLVES